MFSPSTLIPKILGCFQWKGHLSRYHWWWCGILLGDWTHETVACRENCIFTKRGHRWWGMKIRLSDDYHHRIHVWFTYMSYWNQPNVGKYNDIPVPWIEWDIWTWMEIRIVFRNQNIVSSWWVGESWWLGGGNSNHFFMFTPNLGVSWSKFDVRIFFRWVGNNHQLDDDSGDELVPCKTLGANSQWQRSRFSQ